MNREEIEWITRNLFVGNKLWSGTKGTGGKAFDLRDIKAPIVLFASMGDNITPPQQAFNWVADVYGSTDEIKARGQVIVGLLHQDIGHLGIFVSGKVAKKEHAQIVSVLKSIESLPPGLYGMQIHEVKGRDGKVEYEVDFHERRLEDVAKQLESSRARRREAVRGRGRDLGVQPARLRALRAAVRPVAGQRGHREGVAAVPSAALPALGVLGPQSLARVARPRGAGGQGAAPAGRRRQPRQQGREDDVRGRSARRSTITARSATRPARRRSSRPTATCSRSTSPTSTRRDERAAESAAEPRELPFVKEALASIEEGGYAGGAGPRRRRCSRGAGAPLPLARLALKQRAHRRVSRPAARLRPRRVAAHPRRAGHHRPLRAREGDRDAAQAAREARRSRAAGDAGPPAAGRRAHAAFRADDRAARDDREHRRDARRGAGAGPGQGAGTQGDPETRPEARRDAAQGPLTRERQWRGAWNANTRSTSA